MQMMRPPRCLNHRLQHRLRQRERRRQVRRQHRVPILTLHAQQQLVPRDACVVYQDVDPRVPLDDRRHELLRTHPLPSRRALTASARPPAPRISSATGPALSPRAAATTSAPCLASCAAMALPIPRDAPVTMATRFDRSIICDSASSSQLRAASFQLSAFLTARGAPPPLALARRLRASSFDAAQDDPEPPVEGSLGPQALLTARGAPPPLALARRLRASSFDAAQDDLEPPVEGSLRPQAVLTARGAPPPLALARRLRASSFDAAQDDPEPPCEGSLGPQASSHCSWGPAHSLSLGGYAPRPSTSQDDPEPPVEGSLGRRRSSSFRFTASQFPS